MDSTKRKKSGHEFRKEKKVRELQESSKSCSKITSFYLKNDPSTATVSEQQPGCSKNVTENIYEPTENQNVDNTELTKIQISLKHSEPQPENCKELKSINISNSAKIENTVNVVLTTPSPQESLLEKFCTSPSSAIHQDILLQTDKDYFVKPNMDQLSDFFQYHPKQPKEEELPFLEKKKIFTVQKGDGISFHRQWLSFNQNNKKLYCFICLVYSSIQSPFCTGFDDWRHVHQRIQQHECSKTHLESASSFMAAKNKKSTYDLLFNDQLSKRKQEVMERRHIIEVIVDVLKLIGKQGLPLRASSEQAHKFHDESINHGNFLEILFLLSKYNATLKSHLSEVTKKSLQSFEKRAKKEKESGEKKKVVGRGSHVTFLSNNTLVKIIKILRDEIQNSVSARVKKAVNFSILMDTTIDISGNDQCSYVVRYVNGSEVQERLLSLKCVTSTKAEALMDSLDSTLKKVGIPLENCIANAFDGASNMSGAYTGLTAKLAEKIPNHIHTWCYAHVLNLVLSDTAQILPETITFFGLLQEAQVFLKESLKRQQFYTAENPVFKLGAIGATRWRSRSDATVKIFGRIDNWISSTLDSSQVKHVFYELAASLQKISLSDEFNPAVRSNATGLLTKFLDFKTIVVAMTFLQIFKVTTPLSDYLQTKNLDYAQAWRLIESATVRLKELRDRFNETLEAAKTFVNKFNEKVEASYELQDQKDLSIEPNFKINRTKKVKKMDGEKCKDERVSSSPEDDFRINVFYCIVDKIIQTMENRFAKHKLLYLDLAVFDPRRFDQMKVKLPENALDKVNALIPSVDKDKLREQIVSFINVWPSISRKSIEQDYCTEKSLSNENIQQFESVYEDLNVLEDEEETVIGEDEDFSACSVSSKCNACIKCAFEVIVDFNMYSLQYTELYKVYKYLLTIPLTQVTCERVFSKLKIIKTRLRSTMTDDNLEAFVLMNSERDILINIDSSLVIEKLCQSSSEMRRLLIV